MECVQKGTNKVSHIRCVLMSAVFLRNKHNCFVNSEIRRTIDTVVGQVMFECYKIEYTIGKWRKHAMEWIGVRYDASTIEMCEYA